MSPAKKNLRIVSVVVILAAIVAFSFILPKLRGDKSKDSAETVADAAAATKGKDTAIRVSARPAEMKDLVLRISATGLTRAVKEIAVCPKVSGQIARLAIKTGDFVKQGDLLMSLDDREFRLALQEARDQLLGAQAEYGFKKRDYRANPNLIANIITQDSGKNPSSQAEQELVKAQKKFDEAKQKFEKGEISEEDYKRAQFDYETAQIVAGQKQDEMHRQKSGLTRAYITVQRAELNLQNTKIYAPFSGFIGDLSVAEGQQISAGKECFKILDLSEMEVDLQVLENEIGWLKTGRKAELTFPAFPGEVYHGRVSAINPIVDPESKTVAVTVKIANPENKILPGMFAYAKLEAQILKNRFLVPKEAILIRDQRKLLFIVRDGLAKWCYVTTGQENENYVEILDSTLGLKPGEPVITEGNYTLVHDAKVTVQ